MYARTRTHAHIHYKVHQHCFNHHHQYKWLPQHHHQRHAQLSSHWKNVLGQKTAWLLAEVTLVPEGEAWMEQVPSGWLMKDSAVFLVLAECWGGAHCCSLQEAAGGEDACLAASGEAQDVEVGSISVALRRAGMCLVVTGAVASMTTARDDWRMAGDPGDMHQAGFEDPVVRSWAADEEQPPASGQVPVCTPAQERQLAVCCSDLLHCTQHQCSVVTSCHRLP